MFRKCSVYLNAASDMWANPFLICCGTSEQYEIGIEARGIFLLLPLRAGHTLRNSRTVFLA